MNDDAPTPVDVGFHHLACAISRRALRCAYIAFVGAMCLSGGVLRAQVISRQLAHMHHSAWTEREGLAPGVSALHRSADGYLWIGVQSGLIRFDGVHFVRVDSTHAPALQSTRPGPLSPLLLDRHGTLWISRPDGALVQYRDRVFREVLPPSKARGRVSSLVEDRSGRVWANAARSFYLDAQFGVHDIPMPPGVRLESVQGIAADTGTGLWFGTRTGQIWHITADGRSTQVPIIYRGDGGVRPVLQTRDGTLWILNRGVERLREGGTWEIVRSPQAPFAEVNATRAAELADGSVVITSRGRGVMRYHNGRVDDFLEADGLTDAVCRMLHVDREGSIWVTTDGGLDRLRPASFIALGPRDGIPFETPGLMWLDVGGGIWTRDYGSQSLFLADSGLVRNRVGPVRLHELRPPQRERYLILGVGRREGLWMMNNAFHLLRYANGQVRRVVVDDMPARVPMRVHEDRDGGVWLNFNSAGGGGGFGVIRNNRFRRVRGVTLADASWASRVLEDSLGSIWVGMEAPSQLLRIVGDSVVARLLPDEGTAFVQYIVEGGDTLWAVHGGKLARIAQDRVALVRFERGEATLRGGGVGIQISSGHLWFGSDVGIGRIPLETLHRAADGDTTTVRAEWFGEHDGLRAARLVSSDRNATLTTPDGRVWFATPAGLAVVDPQHMLPAPPAPNTIVESVTADGHVLPFGARIEVPPQPERVELAFTATGLLVPERVRLQYRMDGVDGAWRDAPATRTTTYTQLRRGRYTFRVRSAIDGFGPRFGPGTEASVQLVVLPAWYETWWFIALVALAICATIVLVVRASMRARIRRDAERMQARFDAELGERTRLARELHDTLLQGFTGITLQLQAVQSQVEKSPTQAAASLDRILTLADASLREARTMVWDMRAPELGQQDLASALEAGARAAIGGADIALTCAVDGPRRRLSPFLETALLRIGREAVVNAVKHAHATTIAVRLVFSAGSLTVTVEDNGRGLPTDAHDATSDNGHWGVRGMRERAQQIGGTFTMRSAPGSGTCVEVVVPLDNGVSSTPPEGRGAVRTP